MVVGLGAGFGAVARLLVELIFADQARSLMVINLAGSLTLGLLVGLGLAAPQTPGRGLHRLHLLLGPGFLGGFTTFSTLMVEVIVSGSPTWVLLLALQLIAGVMLALIGVRIGGLLRR